MLAIVFVVTTTLVVLSFSLTNRANNVTVSDFDRNVFSGREAAGLELSLDDFYGDYTNRARKGCWYYCCPSW